MATASYVKLEVNQPITGTVKYVAHYDERENPTKPGTTYSAQWILTGSWRWTSAESGEEVTAEGKIGIDEYQLAASPVALGLAVQDGNWDDGNPKYKWTGKGPIRLVKTAQGKKHHVTIQSSTTAAGAAPPPPVASAGTDRNNANVRISTSATPVSGPLSTKDTEEWRALSRVYKRSVAIARGAWYEENAPQVLSDEALAAAAATVFIQACRAGLSVPAPVEKLTPEQKAETIRKALDDYAEPPKALKGALEDDDDDFLPF